MAKQSYLSPWLKFITLLVAGGLTSLSLSMCGVNPNLTEIPSETATSPSPSDNSCATITAPLTPEEGRYAQAAWQYFLNNRQPDTGFINSADNYPAGTLWDMGNYLMALNAVRWLDLIDQAEFDYQLNHFLTSLGELPLFEDTLPNKVYNSATGKMVDYDNTPTERGLGWSALDIGRLLTAFHIIRSCHPQYSDWLAGLVERWHIARSIEAGQLYGATVTPQEEETLLVQEGRLGYEEYAAKGYELWGFAAPKALNLTPMKKVEVEGVEILVDARNYQTTNANNYIVSESYILEGIEFGLQNALANQAADILEAQKRRYQATGQLTAVSEDNVNQPPHFLYNTVYANGEPWAVITEDNESHPRTAHPQHQSGIWLALPVSRRCL